MNAALWGVVTALCWGTADFIARFTSRGFGHVNALLGMLLVGSLALSAWVLAGPGLPASMHWDKFWLLTVSGAGVSLATMWLYQALARGPVSIVAPIVGSYPVGVVALAVALGARPRVAEWLTMVLVIVGVVVVARSGERADPQHAAGVRLTVLMALGAAVAFAVAISAGQAVVPVYGELNTIWLSRLIGLAALLAFVLVRRVPVVLPLRWWPLIALQGLLDTGAYLALFAGSHGADAAFAAVTASAFGAVTVLLAWTVLRERIAPAQWLGMLMIFAGVAYLSAG